MLFDDTIRPKILVFAGPNGSGKSTITKNIPKTGLYINADEIKREEHITDLEAAQMAEALREKMLDLRMDFTFETVLSTERNLDLLLRAKEAGYSIQAVFVMTNDPAVNVSRVKARAKAGGHPVPEEKIVSRYEKSIKNISRLVRIADRTRIIDNTGSEPELIADVKNGSVVINLNNHWSKADILALFDLGDH